MTRLFLPAFLALLSLAQISAAALEVASIFGDHMVLQRDKAIPVWGTASPNEQVKVSLGGHEVTTTTGPDGRWMTALPPQPVGKAPLTLTVSTGTETTTFSDVLMGDVWVCSGQSNMEWQVKNSKNAEQELANANYPEIRLFKVGKNAAAAPADKVQASWQPCAPESVASFSAVGYFFGRELAQELNIPIGLIGTYWGGTPAEAWTRPTALENNPDFEPILNRRALYLDGLKNGTKQTEAERKLSEWLDKLARLADHPTPPVNAWWSSEGGQSGWQPIAVPGKWENTLSNFDGVVWFRHEFTAPAGTSLNGAILNLGTIDDFDAVWINGHFIGQTDTKTPNAYEKKRSYPIPDGVLKEGTNVVLVRVVDWYYDGGFTGLARDIQLVPSSGTPIALAGQWEAHIEADLGIRPPSGKANPQNVAGTLYDGMIAPLLPYAIKGAIWYQGESNASRAWQYRSLFPNMISNWREDWKQGDFPFYFVQLANFRARQSEPVGSDWAELREAQFTTLSLPNTGMAVTIDVGEADDIHPKDKQTVGHRLALIALSKDYGITTTQGKIGNLPGIGKFFRKPLEYSGPVYRSMKDGNGQIVLFFDHVDGGLKTSGDGPPKGFSIAGEDRNFVWADAVIQGNTVVVSSPQVPHPIAVRYAWADNPECNLANKEGLPASPFRTDEWPGVTVDNK